MRNSSGQVKRLVRFCDAVPPPLSVQDPVGLPPLPRLGGDRFVSWGNHAPGPRSEVRHGQRVRPQLRIPVPSGLGKRASRTEKERRGANSKARTPIPSNLYRPSPVTCRRDGDLRKAPTWWTASLDQWTNGEWHLSPKDRARFAAAGNRNTVLRANDGDRLSYLIRSLSVIVITDLIGCASALLSLPAQVPVLASGDRLGGASQSRPRAPLHDDTRTFTDVCLVDALRGLGFKAILTFQDLLL